MLWKVGLKEQRERKNKSEVTQEVVEGEVNKKKNIQEMQEKKRVAYTNEERRENRKVKEYEKLSEIK